MTTRQRHDAAVASVAARYRREGYEVVLEPTDADLPAFAKGYRPDLLATRTAENLLVEVKLPRSPPGDWSKLIRDIAQNPGWTFVFIVAPVADEDELDFPIFDASAIRRQLDEPAKLLESGQPLAALLVAWSLFESAARLRVALDGQEPRATSSEGLVKRLIHLGHLEQGDLHPWTAIARLRNRAAHGDLNVAVQAADIARLRAATESLLEQQEAA